LGMWLTDLAALHLVVVALGIDVSIGGSMLVLVGVNVAIALPAAPAHLGTLELGAMVPLELLGVGREQALAFALIYHAMQALPLAGRVGVRFILAPLDGRRAADRERHPGCTPSFTAAGEGDPDGPPNR